MGLKMTKEQALATLGQWLGVPVAWLDTLIRGESNWNPTATNKISGARGLIQFMPQTAKDLGYANPTAIVNKYPDIPSQLLGPVAAYFKLPGKKGPYPTKQSLYMAVFYPAYRNVSPNTVMPSSVRKSNPGIDTVQNYVDHADGKAITHKKNTIVFPLLIMGIIGYFAAKKLKLF